MPKVTKRGALFYVVDEANRPLGVGHVLRERAEEDLSDMIRASQRTIRTCMTCQKPFESEGSHNRMCPSCKRRSDR